MDNRVAIPLSIGKWFLEVSRSSLYVVLIWLAPGSTSRFVCDSDHTLKWPSLLALDQSAWTMAS